MKRSAAVVGHSDGSRVRIDEIPVRGLKPNPDQLVQKLTILVRIDEIPVRGLKRAFRPHDRMTNQWVRIDEIPVRGLKRENRT